MEEEYASIWGPSETMDAERFVELRTQAREMGLEDALEGLPSDPALWTLLQHHEKDLQNIDGIVEELYKNYVKAYRAGSQEEWTGVDS